MEEFLHNLDQLRDSRNLKRVLAKHKNEMKTVSQEVLDAMADVLSQVWTKLSRNACFSVFENGHHNYPDLSGSSQSATFAAHDILGARNTCDRKEANGDP